MARKKDLLIEYDDLLIGKRTSFSDRFFSEEGVMNMKNALLVMQYAFDVYLRWTPEEIATKMTKEIMVKMKLQPLMKFVTYPEEYKRERDYYYLSSLLYKKCRIDPREKVIHIYEKVLNGDRKRYPKDYFLGSEGIVRSGICLQYMINQNMIFSDINTLYYTFSSKEGVNLLKKYKLLSVCNETFETPVDYLHFALPIDMKNELFHQYYKFKYLVNTSTGKRFQKFKHTNYKLEGEFLK